MKGENYYLLILLASFSVLCLFLNWMIYKAIIKQTDKYVMEVNKAVKDAENKVKTEVDRTFNRYFSSNLPVMIRHEIGKILSKKTGGE